MISEESMLLTQKLPFPPQQQRQPGRESEMVPRPYSIKDSYRPAGKLMGKIALITGGDSGIGRAVAAAFAMEGANVAILYRDEAEDAYDTMTMIEQLGQRCLTLSGDVGQEEFCREAVLRTVNCFGGLDILVNNAAEQHVQARLEDITEEQLLRTFRTNIFSCFFMAKAALPYLKNGSAIINTTSVTAYEGHDQLMDYSVTKGAIVTFTRSLSQNLVGLGVRVNAVAPGPVWTPLIPASFNAAHVTQFGANTPMKRAGQPAEIAPAYVFLACDDSSYMTGQVIHINGGTIVNG